MTLPRLCSFWRGWGLWAFLVAMLSAVEVRAQVGQARYVGASVHEVVSDGAGGVLVAGRFRSPADFDGDGHADITADHRDGFVARYDADGAFVFAVHMEGTDRESMRGVVSDGAGGAFVTGTALRTVDTNRDGVRELQIPPQSDAFVARYDESGRPVFVTRISRVDKRVGLDLVRPEGMVSDGRGGAFVIGSFVGPVDFDGDGFAEATGNTEDIMRRDAFIAHYDAFGNLLFARRAAFTIECNGGIASDGAGGVLVYGGFRRAADLDDDGIPDLTSERPFDQFVARYDAAGDLVFATKAGWRGGTTVCGYGGIASDGSGGVLLTGNFSGSPDFDGDGIPDLNSLGEFDAFVARYDGSGRLVFAVRAGGSEDDIQILESGRGITPDGAGGALVTGSFVGRADFDDDGIPDLTSAGDEDVFVAHYNGAGHLVSVMGLGGPEEDAGEGITLDMMGRAVIVTSFENAVDLDGDGHPDVSSDGQSGGFMVHLEGIGAPAEPPALLGVRALTTRPNPVDHEATVVVTLERPAAPASVVLYDALGRRVGLLYEGPLAAGQTSLPLVARALAPGVYVVRVEMEGEAQNRQITVVR